MEWSILLSALALAVIGILTVRSASAELGPGYWTRQLTWTVLGLVVFVLCMLPDHRRLLAAAVSVYAVAAALLGLVLAIGRVGGGARSWIVLGPARFQPSELAKLATVLLLARVLASHQERWLSLRQILWVGLLAGLPMALLALQPDLGGAAMFVPATAAMLFVAGVRWRWLLGATVVALLLGGTVWFFGMQDYQRDRITTFLAPGADPLGAGYQVRQSKIAVGSGGLMGRGYLQGTQSQLRFLPARHTDFILAVLAEEWGFLGVAVVLGLYATLLAGMGRVALRSRDRASLLMVTGLWAFFAFHILYNGAMVVGLAPITGIPLPFLSYGGSFCLFNFAATGLVLGVDYRRYVNR